MGSPIIEIKVALCLSDPSAFRKYLKSTCPKYQVLKKSKIDFPDVFGTQIMS